MMIFVTKAQYISDYKVHVFFNDERNGILDLKDTIFQDHRNIFSELKEVALFKKFHVDRDTIVWDNGLDLAPEFLYNMTLFESIANSV